MVLGIVNGTEVDEGIVQLGRGIIGGRELFLVVVVAETATEDALHASLAVFHVGIGLQHVLDAVAVGVGGVNHGQCFVADAVGVVFRAFDFAAQVVAAVDMVAQIGEAVQAYVGLGMAEDIGVARAGERVEQATVVQVHVGAAEDGAFEAAAIDKLHVGQIRRTVGATGNALAILGVVEGDVGAVFLFVFSFADGGIVVVATFVGFCGSIQRAFCPVGLADGSALAAAKDLEGVALGDVDGGAAPNLRAGTLAAAKDGQCLAQHVHALLVEDDAGVALSDVVTA